MCTMAGLRNSHSLKFLIPVIAVLTVAVVCEVGLRVYHFLKEGLSVRQWPYRIVGHYGATTLDKDLGWKATEDYSIQRTETSLEGRPYTVVINQDTNGFRQFGDLKSDKPKVLVVGDSFTHALEVSDGNTYYSIMGKKLNVEIFAYGVGNYGTLQEFMIIDRYLEKIRPQIVIWQLCSNDFMNNDADLYNASNFHNDFRERPYWLNGQVVYILPESRLVGFRRWGYKYSQFFVFIMTRVDQLTREHVKPTIEEQIEQLDEHHHGFARAVRTTSELLAIGARRIAPAQIVAFNCDIAEPYNRHFQRLAKQVGMIFLDDVARAVQHSAEEGNDVYHADSTHWNEKGDAIAAGVLGDTVKKLLEQGSVAAAVNVSD